MFTGIVRGVGRILESSDSGGDRRIVVGFGGTPVPSPSIGASIAVNGVCLTATESAADRFAADVSRETLAVTNLAQLSPGARVNLEPSLRLGDPVDGHLVSGHVDGLGKVLSLEPSGRSVVVTIELPAALARYVARKGSVAVDGVSLTVNAVRDRRFEVNIVPHTRDLTTISDYRPGTAVNIEVDLLARYVERLGAGAAESSGIDLDYLKRHGYHSDD